MATIQQLSPTSYSLTARGSQMLLEQTPKGWVMKTRNASTRVWGMGGERSEERRVGKECRSRWSPYH